MTQMLELGAINQLRRVGLRPKEAALDAILALGSAAIPSLLDLALDTALLLGDAPGAYAPVHALRLLGKLPAGEHAERVIRTSLPDAPAKTDADFTWTSDQPQIVGSWGAPAIPGILAVIADSTVVVDQRAQAVEALSYAAEADLTQRDQIVGELRTLLEQEQDTAVLTAVVQALADLRVADAYKPIMALYSRGAVDRAVLSAGDARKLLLGSDGKNRLACVHHSLSERYDQHGPFTNEQRQAMADYYRQMNEMA